MGKGFPQINTENNKILPGSAGHAKNCYHKMSSSWGHSNLSHVRELVWKRTQEFSHGASCSSFLLFLRTKRQNLPHGREKLDLIPSSAWLCEVCVSATTSGLHPWREDTGKWEFCILSRQLQPGFVHSGEENQGIKWITKSCTVQDQQFFLISPVWATTGQGQKWWQGGMEAVPLMVTGLQTSPHTSPLVGLISLKKIPPSRVW